MKRIIKLEHVVPALALGALALGTPQGVASQERLSPLDSATVVLEGHQFDIQYGRPSMRERTIYGGLVPWDQVWRTGANEATHIRIPVDIEIGDETVPAGHYTLFTIPSQGGWTLVINSQTGQWGTAYDQSQDFVRVPMATSALDAPLEQFTITIAEGDGSDGVIHFDWEQTRAVLEFDLAGG
ncbi:MAG: DUF2911 domain-containing protein [Gemmatimonadetes bacterium]|nr:DUF2911 domain-containing protein [Gemmatimonadota bacterium]